MSWRGGGGAGGRGGGGRGGFGGGRGGGGRGGGRGGGGFRVSVFNLISYFAPNKKSCLNTSHHNQKQLFKYNQGFMKEMSIIESSALD